MLIERSTIGQTYFVKVIRISIKGQKILCSTTYCIIPNLSTFKMSKIYDCPPPLPLPVLIRCGGGGTLP